MSEIKLISPLLDGFAMGNPMSEHNGVRCCPAIKENTDKKYIVKIISVPASQVQMDALLLAGAYKDPADAMEYFRQVGEQIIQEAEFLKTLSKLDGFLPYEGWQMEPITRRRLGYEVYLIGSYKRSLEKYLKKHPVTHLEAMNLGLDLCAALSMSREAGALYVALKPANIFVSEKKEYKIGDLGFIKLDALAYTALPEKYHSPYTPPELFDPMASMNLTADTYAVGMILYQLYNDGQLPFKGPKAPEETFPSPVNADYELAEIIMKAIHRDPAERWNDPKDLGKALAAYMQRNSVNDVPITPHTPLDISPEDIVVLPKKKTVPEADAAPAAEIPEAGDNAPPAPPEESPAEAASEEISEETDASPDPEAVEGSGEEAVSDNIPFEEVEPIPGETSSESQPDVLSDALSRMIAQADDLIAHETPQGVILPEPEEEPDPFAFVKTDEEDEEYAEEPDDSDIPEGAENAVPVRRKEKKKKAKKFADPKYKRRKKRFLSFLLTLLILSGMGAAAFWYYQNIYLQPIDSILIDGGQDQITVTVDSDVKDSMLVIRCSDQYGAAYTKVVTDGQATFTNLQPNTMYTIQLEIDGFHKLVGKTSDVFTTDATTRITSFTSVAGAEDGSVMLNFTVDGEEPNDWTVFYSAEGEDEVRKTFSGHSVTISDLTIGKVYTFRLETGENMDLGGETTLEILASRLILAEDLAITSDNGTDITVTWKVPGDVVVDSWNVRCYNDMGYEEQLTVTDTQVLFPGIDPAASYTVEVTASGMTQPARTSITANPLNITALTVDDSSHEELNISWEFTGTPPEDGWLLIYALAGGEKHVVKCDKASAAVSPRVPGGKYEFLVQAADGTTVFNSVHNHTVPEAKALELNGLTADMLTADLLKTPEEAKWYYENIQEEDLTDTFSSGDNISIVLRSSGSFYLPGSEVKVLYVIQDSYGNILSELVAEDRFYWKDLWNGGDVKNGELDLPAAPTAAGEYVLNLYFDGMSVAQLPFTITQ